MSPPCGAPQVYDVCGNDYRLYASPLIKFQKACTQLVAGTLYRLAGQGHTGALRAVVLAASPELCLAVMDLTGSCSSSPACQKHCKPPPPAPAVRIGYPCFGTPRRVNGKIVG